MNTYTCTIVQLLYHLPVTLNNTILTYFDEPFWKIRGILRSNNSPIAFPFFQHLIYLIITMENTQNPVEISFYWHFSHFLIRFTQL